MEVAAGREGLQNGLEERFIRLLAERRPKPAFVRPVLAMVTFVAPVLWFARPTTNDENLTSWRGLTEISSRQNK